MVTGSSKHVYAPPQTVDENEEVLPYAHILFQVVSKMF